MTKLLSLFAFFTETNTSSWLHVPTSTSPISLMMTLSLLNPRLHCDFLLALTTCDPQSCAATKVEGSCTCSQVSPISATCFKEFNSKNILQHCPSDFVAEPAPGYTVHHSGFKIPATSKTSVVLPMRMKMSHV